MTAADPSVKVALRRTLVGFCLVTGGLVLALAGAVLALVANVRGDEPSGPDPHAWLGQLALWMMIGWLAWAFFLWAVPRH